MGEVEGHQLARPGSVARLAGADDVLVVFAALHQGSEVAVGAAERLTVAPFNAALAFQNANEWALAEGQWRNTLKLRPDEVFVSPIDLNQENGAIETPPVPTLRVSTPVLAPDGKPFGIFVINVDKKDIAQLGTRQYQRFQLPAGDHRIAIRCFGALSGWSEASIMHGVVAGQTAYLAVAPKQACASVDPVPESEGRKLLSNTGPRPGWQQ